MDDNQQLTTPAVDLFAPADRFASASKLYGRLHRWQLVLRRYGWMVGLIVLGVTAPVGYLTLKSPPVYESKARLWLKGKLNFGEGRLYTEELIDYLGTQAELLRSPAIQERALARMGTPLHSNTNSHSLNTGSLAGLGFVAKAKELWGQLTQTGAATTNRAASSSSPFRVTVDEARKNSMLELRAVGAEAASTQAFLDLLMDEFLNFKREAREKTTERTVTSVGAQVAELAEALEAQQEKLHAFQSSNNVVFLQEQGNNAGSYLAMLNRRLANLRTELTLLRSLLPEQWVERQASRETAPPDESMKDDGAAREMLASLAGPQLELFKATQQMQLLKAKRDELSRFLRPLHPKIIKLDEDIQTQEKLAQISRNEAVNQMKHRRQAIEVEIRNLEAAFGEWDAKAIETSRKMADYERIRQDLQRLQGAYDKMLALIQTVDVSRTVEQENVGILDPASAATPVNHLLRNLSAALAGSLLLGCGLLYCLGVFRDDFSSLTELGDCLSEEVMGQVPSIATKNLKGQLGLEALEKQRFEFLESFRNIRSSLLFMNHGRAKPRTILVASAVPEEGKSTIALYLAATMAMSKARVLLVDADMRRGRLHEFFGADSRPGLAEILNRESSSASAIVHPELGTLALLPAGEAKRNPGELVLSSRWTHFLTEARAQFDYILVDTPPVLATDDAAVLAPKVDGVLFVVRASYTSARMARSALDLLRRRHVNMMGLILNRAVSSPYLYHSYQRYRRAYGWEPREAGRGNTLAGVSVSGVPD